MNDSKLVELLRSMSVSDLKALRKWVKAHGSKKDAFSMFEYILKNLEPSRPDKLSKQKIFSSLFKSQPYNDLKLRYMGFELLKMCEDFIVFSGVTKHPDQYQIHLMQYYRKHYLNKFFEQTFKLLKQQLNEQPVRDSDYFFANMQADSEYNKFLISKQNRAIEPNIQRLSDDLDMFYLLNKLKVYSEALNYKNILKVDYDIKFAEHLLEEIRKWNLKQFPALEIHYLALLTLLENEKEEHFYKLKSLIEKNRRIFAEEELKDFYTIARNYCIKKINLGNKKFARELFGLYQWELELLNGSETQELSPAAYKNISTLAFLLNELDWVFQFIERYTDYLPEEHRSSYYNFNMANYYFKKCSYEKVIELLSQVEYRDFFIQLSAKALLMKTYFELKEYSPFDSLVHSFKILLQSKKVLGYHRSNYLNFIKYCSKMLFRENLSKKELSALEMQISETRELAEKEWLLEKLQVRRRSPS